jgi:hypothetical protein
LRADSVSGPAISIQTHHQTIEYTGHGDEIEKMFPQMLKFQCIFKCRKCNMDQDD